MKGEKTTVNKVRNSTDSEFYTSHTQELDTKDPLCILWQEKIQRYKEILSTKPSNKSLFNCRVIQKTQQVEDADSKKASLSTGNLPFTQEMVKNTAH